MVTELKAGHLYKYENNNTLMLGANVYVIYEGVVGHIQSPNLQYGTLSWRGNCIGNNIGYPRNLGIYTYELNPSNPRGYPNFKGSAYFISRNGLTGGDATPILNCVTEIKDFFVFDRTQADVDFAKEELKRRSLQRTYEVGELKGCLNAFDINRIQSNIIMLRDDLVEWGYSVPTLIAPTWVDYSKVLTSTIISNILNNIDLLKDFFYEPQGWIELPTTMNHYEDINAIEKDLYLMRMALEELKQMSPRAGTFNAYSRDGKYNILPLKVN